MKLVFLGTSELAALSLKALHKSSHQVTLVVTQPDRGAGRGRKTTPPPVKVEAERLGLPIVQPENVNTRAFRALVREHEPDVLVVAAFGQILRPLLLALPPHGCLNVHASILPRHRGASPINAAILHGDQEVGVSIMQMDEGMDTGPVGLVGTCPAIKLETAGQLHDRLAILGGDLIVRALNDLEAGVLAFEPQDEALSTHAAKMAKSDGLIRIDRSADEVLRQICGLTPWPGCFGTIESEQGPKDIIIGEACEGGLPPEDAEVGQVLEVTSKGILVACATGSILIKRLKPAGKRMMPVADFLNGTSIQPGAFLIGNSHE
ncbi:MAG: methionyl-tRNA formyltransferase [Planctomycetota bacterium]|jgi:methionyl-tRNA formyltransferase